MKMTKKENKKPIPAGNITCRTGFFITNPNAGNRAQDIDVKKSEICWNIYLNRK